MPTVPAYDLPTQELASVQLNTFQAPNVQPMQDVSGKQIEAMGKSTMALGTQFQKLADEVRDANVKASDTTFLGEMQNILYNKDSGYLWKKNKDAMEGAPVAYEEFQKSAQKVRDSLTDPMEQQAFDMAVRRHANTFNQMVNRHAGEQTLNYRRTEAEARASSYQDAAIGAFGKPEFQTYLSTAQAEVNAMADMSGVGKEVRDAALLKVNNNVFGNVVANLMLQNKYAEAKTVFDQAVDKGMLTQETQQQLMRTMRTGYASERGRTIADNLGAGKGSIGTDADSIIKWVIGIEGGFVADDAGKGPTNYGINSAANPDVNVKDLTPAKAAEIYKERYWNGIGADKLPENMRAIAFDAAVNQGVSTANKLVAQAMKTDNPAQTLIELRREEYSKLIAKNPGKFKQYENSWNARLDALESNLSIVGAPPKTLNEQVSNINALANAGMIDEPTKEAALNRAESNWKMQINGQAQFSRGVLDTATQWVRQHPGADLSQMDPIMQQNLKNTGHWQTIMNLQKNNGQFKQNDAAWGQFLLMSDQQKAEMTVDQFTNAYRGKLDDDRYQQGAMMIAQLRGEVKKGQNTEVFTNQERIKFAAQTAKIIPFEGKAGEDEQKNYAKFQMEIESRVKQFENTKLGGKRKVDSDELESIIQGVLTDKAKTGGIFGFFASEKPVALMDQDKMSGAYIDVEGRRIKLMSIGANDRKVYADKLRKAGIPVTQNAIARLWAADNPEK